MTLQTLASRIFTPGWTGITAGNPGFTTSNTLDSAGEYEAYIFVAKEAMTITHVGYRTGTVVGSPTLDVRVETVDATTGFPSGTLWATNTNIVSGTLASNTWYLDALTASATVAAGDVVCIKWAYNSGTSVVLSLLSQIGQDLNPGNPYRVRNVGTPGKVQGLPFCAALGSSATAFYNMPAMQPASAVSNKVGSTSTLDALGVRFRLPFTCRVVALKSTNAVNSGPATFGIYSDAGAELSSSSTAEYDRDMLNNAGSVQIYYWLDSPVTLTANTWYRGMFFPTTTTNFGFAQVTAPSADYSEAMWCGADWHYTTLATDGTTWDDSATTEHPLIDLVIDQLDDGVSAGGGGGGIRLAGRGGLAG